MKNRGLVVLFAGIGVFAAPVSGRQDFAAYDGPDAVKTGEGGTRVTKNGIDYWTTGTPPRRYQILGTLTDARKNRITDGNALGSKSVAEKTLAAGGNAVIIMDASTETVGVRGGSSTQFYGNNVFTANSHHLINRTTTQMFVVKYLDPQ